MPAVAIPETIGASLEADRLRHRTARMALVVAALRQRAAERRLRQESVPAPLGHAIRGFEDELRTLRGRLEQLGA